MFGGVAGDQPRRRRTGAGARNRHRRVAHQTRIGGEAEVVVGGEIDDGAAIGLQHGTSSSGDRTKMTFEIAIAKRVQLSGQRVDERG